MMADTSSDFDFPYQGSFYTKADFGILGRELETQVSWALDNNDQVVIHSIEFCLGISYEGNPVWVNLDALYVKSPPVLMEKKKDPDLIYEAEQEYERALAHYRAEGGQKKLGVI